MSLDTICGSFAVSSEGDPMKTLSLSLALFCSMAAHAEPWRITYGTWGGFTGGGGGIELRSDGSLFATKAVVPSHEVRTYQGRVDEKKLQEIYELAQKAGSVSFRHPANMTTSLNFYGDKQYNFAWEIGRTDMPKPVVDWASALQSLRAKPGPGPQWNGEPNSEASATLSLSKDKPVSIKVTLGEESEDFQGTDCLQQAKDLAGHSVSDLKITRVNRWWIEGEHRGKTFRLPLWVMK